MGSPRPRLSMCSISQHCQTSWPPGAGHDVEDTDFADFSQRVRQPLCNWLSVALHTGGSPSFQDKSKVSWRAIYQGCVPRRLQPVYRRSRRWRYLPREPEL